MVRTMLKNNIGLRIEVTALLTCGQDGAEEQSSISLLTSLWPGGGMCEVEVCAVGCMCEVEVCAVGGMCEVEVCAVVGMCEVNS